MIMASRLFRLVLASIGCCGLIACSAKPPGPVETKAAYWVKQHVTVRGKLDRNPIPVTQGNIDAGKQVFGYYCVECHGRDGQNTGVPFAARVDPPIPSMASAEVQAYTDGQLKWIIDNGIFPSGMPASKGTLNDQEVWQMVLYLRNLPRAGSLGEPKAYSGDEFESGQAASPRPNSN
jgi:mono/diheme cytochrome c family protein